MRESLRAPWMPLLVTALLAGVVLSTVKDEFATSYNLFVILQAAAGYALIGFASMVVLAVRDISLAVGGLGSLCAVVFGWAVQDAGWGPWAAAGLALLVGALCGLVNGLVIVGTGLTGFVVTLATGTALTGLALGLTSSAAFTEIPASWTSLGQGRLGFMPAIALITLGVAVVLLVLYRWVPIGRRMLATGGNPEAARLSGISGTHALVTAHVLSGVLAAIAAVVFVGRLGSASPDLGSTWVLISFAVPIIGGTALAGGRVSVPGALVAACVLSFINDALILLDVSQYGVLFAQGALVFVAVLAGRLTNIVVPRPHRREALS